jgi:hypothetical protein
VEEGSKEEEKGRKAKSSSTVRRGGLPIIASYGRWPVRPGEYVCHTDCGSSSQLVVVPPPPFRNGSEPKWTKSTPRPSSCLQTQATQ